jgi:hypothetical protein
MLKVEMFGRHRSALVALALHKTCKR